MLTVEGYSEGGLLRHLSNDAFWQFLTSVIHKLWGWYFFSKNSKFDADLRNRAKNGEKVFCFLLRREYLPSAVNVLTKSPKILEGNWEGNWVRKSLF